MASANVILTSLSIVEKDDFAKNFQQLLDLDENLLPALNYHLMWMDQQDVLLFQFMDERKIDLSKRELKRTLVLLLAQKRYEMTHQKTENVAVYDKHIESCKFLLKALGIVIPEEEAPAIEVPNTEIPQTEYTFEDSPVRYLIMQFGRWFGEQIDELARSKTKSIRNIMGWGNDIRLFWVWENSLFKTILGALPSDFFNVSRTLNIVSMPDKSAGIVSWGLYYFRGGMELSLLFKHLIPHPWMDEEEKKKHWTERLRGQWNQRKFAILNDFVWATGNCLCFFLLVGPGVLGTWGDALTLALLVFDIVLAVWQFAERQDAFEDELSNYQDEISKLEERISLLAEDNPERAELELQKEVLEEALDQCQKDWDYEVLNLKVNIGYAVGLMIAFAIMTLPFLPIAAGPAMIISLTGAALCFIFTVLNNVIKGGLAINRTYELKNQLIQKYESKLKEFTDNKNLDDNARRLLFLEIKKLKADTAYQEQMITYQISQLIRTIIMETVFPAMAFASLVFLPLSTGIILILNSVFLSALSNYLIDKQFLPEKEGLEEFDEEEYQQFCQEQSLLAKSNLGMFHIKPPPNEETDLDDLDDSEIIPLVPGSGQ